METFDFEELFGMTFGQRGKRDRMMDEQHFRIAFRTPRHEERFVGFNSGSGLAATFAKRNIAVRCYDAAGNLLYDEMAGLGFFVNQSGVDPQSLETGLDGELKPARETHLFENTEYFVEFERVNGLQGEPLWLVYTATDKDDVEDKEPADYAETMYHPKSGKAGTWTPND